MTRSKSAQNLKALMSDVVKPAHEAEKLQKEGKLPSQQLQDEVEKDMQETKMSQKERKLYCTSISR